MVGFPLSVWDVPVAVERVGISSLEEEERLRLALEAGRMGTWEWDIATDDVFWSPSLEAIHGLAIGSFAGTFEAYQKSIHPDDRDRVLQAIATSLEHGQDHRVEYRLLWPDGSVHWVEGRGKMFRDGEGQPARMIGVCIDINQRKQDENSLRFLADASEILAVLVDYESTMQKVAALAVPFFADWCSVEILEPGGEPRRIAVAHHDPAKVQLSQELHKRYPPNPNGPAGFPPNMQDRRTSDTLGDYRGTAVK